ncbi:uracil-DNA glycosylase family protein [Sphingobium aquiterrae]|uniref:uracil-DNA glycosylase family protein n=1 Tax=Sphingobium aquiterrae TaxID=2038656 RepID=UPI00301AAFD9
MAWWSLAGVDCAIGEAPVNWLQPPARPARALDSSPPAAAPSPSAPIAPAPSAAPRWPTDIAAFRRWLADSQDILEAAWPGPRILPGEAENAAENVDVMVITDMPDADDIAGGALLGGDAGRLFDAMLAAVGLDRGQCHIASLAVARPIGGLMRDEDLKPLAERMLYHIGLAAPRRLLVLGDRTVRALGATDGGAALRDDAGNLRPVNHGDGIVDAIATLHPRLLLKQPEAKAACWQQLQFLVKGQS